MPNMLFFNSRRGLVAILGLFMSVTLTSFIAHEAFAGERAPRTLRVAPDAIVVGEAFSVTGSHWKSGKSLLVYACEDADNDNCRQIARTKIRPSGRFSIVHIIDDGAGERLRIMACYAPACTSKRMRTVRIVD